jgi:hypothetical protein
MTVEARADVRRLIEAHRDAQEIPEVAQAAMNQTTAEVVSRRYAQGPDAVANLVHELAHIAAASVLIATSEELDVSGQSADHLLNLIFATPDRGSSGS